MNLANGSERISAAVVDGLVFLPFLFLDRWIGTWTQSQFVIFVYCLLSWQFGWLYSTLLHGYRGQTLGKIYKDIKVVRAEDRGPISYGRAAMRDLPVIVMMLASTSVWIYANVAWWGGWYSEEHDAILQKVYLGMLYCNVGWVFLECVTMLLHPQRRAIHDLIAGTIVVRRDSDSSEAKVEIKD